MQNGLHHSTAQAAGDRDDRGDRLEWAARGAANEHVPVPGLQHSVSLRPHLRELERLLGEAHRRFATDPQAALSPAADWFLDNFHVVQETLREMQDLMPGSFYRQLPVVQTASGERLPRIRSIGRAVTAVSSSYLVLAEVQRFVTQYQCVSSLTVGELWALPAMLRLAIVESLTQAAALIAGPLQRGQAVEPSAALRLPVDPASEETVTNCIVSLRELATWDWKAFFESVSVVEQVLRTDPADVYSRMDFETRDRCRKVVEELARSTGRNERDVADAAVGAARARSAGAAQAGHIGFYLLGAGRAQLEGCLGYRPKPPEQIRRWLLAHAALTYLGSIGLLTGAIVAAALRYAHSAGGTALQLWVAGLATMLPATEVAIQTVNFVVTHVLPASRLPRMDFDQGIPFASRAVVVMPTLLTGPGEAEAIVRQLELHYLGNSDPNLRFALLTDFADGPQESMPGDQKLIGQVRAEVRALNEKYGGKSGGPFYLFHRERQWNAADGLWMGWERKRGKLADFNRLLCGDRSENHFVIQDGDLAALEGARYVITLDRDTGLPAGSARRLVATLAHPLNQAQFDPESGVVVSGYTILQPRIQVWPTATGRSRFSQVFAGDTVLDLYTTAVSDVYQDLFGQGIYAGKGVYDAEAMERSLSGKVPGNALLSHDLFEGLQGRAGLCSDVTLFEDYPPSYLTYALRRHRWIRGDWQLLPWLGPTVPGANGARLRNTLSLLDRWRILDNLRRSLLDPSWLLLLVAGWLALPGSTLLWTLFVLAVSAIPFALQLSANLLGRTARPALRSSVPTLSLHAARWLLSIAFLADDSLVALDAITRTLVRVFVTRRKLLEWTTTARLTRIIGTQRRLEQLWARMWAAPLLALVLTWLAACSHPAGLPASVPFLLAWLASPQIAFWIDSPVLRSEARVSDEQRQLLRTYARRTWLYFEQFIGPEDHWLPPDHYQEDPLGSLARHTSPTNTGMLLLSTLAAHDLGYIGPRDLALRLSFTFESLDRMERHRGHFLNWYDTRNLQPLAPRYVSTVDSGNLAACLLTLRQGCWDVVRKPLLDRERLDALLDGLHGLSKALGPLETSTSGNAVVKVRDCIAGLRCEIEGARGNGPGWWGVFFEQLRQRWESIENELESLLQGYTRPLDAETIGELRIWLDISGSSLQNTIRDVDDLLPWHRAFGTPPMLLERTAGQSRLAQAWDALVAALPPKLELVLLPGACQQGRVLLAELQLAVASSAEPSELVRAAVDWCADLAARLESAQHEAARLLDDIESLAARAEAYFEQMDFGFLFDAQRQVFHIGYNADAGRFDESFYDLLASEARLASLVAIAKGDVPNSHWLHMDRSFTQVGGKPALLSWSGTAFEYLMPSLLMHSYPGTVLHETNEAVVSRQIAYGREKHVPWGISESGFYEFDGAENYQYRAFGVTGLGFKRGLNEDLVVSPYASLLALSLRPDAVLANARRLVSQGLLGRYGFYEAIDYTPSRGGSVQQGLIVRSYMSHHQGMILLSIVNYLMDAAMVRRFHKDLRLQSVDFLLHEGLPEQASLEYPGALEIAQPSHAVSLPIDAPWSASVRPQEPQMHALSNGSYTVLISSDGAGYSMCNGLDLTRWRSDATLDAWGTWIYIQDLEQGAMWSAGYQPTASPPEREEVLFYASKAELRREDHGISLRTEIVVSADHDVEVRQLTFTNLTARRRRLRVSSYGEVVLGPHEADVRHQAFAKLFVDSEFLPELNALLFQRRPRSVNDEPAFLAHLLVAADGRKRAPVRCETDRARFLGRGRSPRLPSALTEGAEGLSSTAGTVVDPVMCLEREIDLAPHDSMQLAFITLAASTREWALALAHRYQAWPVVRHAFGRTRDLHRQELRESGLTTLELQHMQQLLSAVLNPHGALRASPETLIRNCRGQSALWPFAISGDYPILLVTIRNREEAGLLYDVLRAHAYWRKRQLKVDLVILNEQPTGYATELHGYVLRVVTRTGGDAWLNRRGGIFLIGSDQLDETARVLLETAARVVLRADHGPLTSQLGRLTQQPGALPAFTPSRDDAVQTEPTPMLSRPERLLCDNGLGGFSLDGREYVIYLEPGRSTPAPWINVIANPQFGFLVSEAGSGCTWAENSGENRLTPWRNDPVSDTPGEALYLRDEETGRVWSPTPLPSPAPAAYLVRHGAGYSVFQHHSHGLKQELHLFAAPNAPVKIVRLRLENAWKRPRRVTATYFAEWVLGTERGATQQYIVPEFDAEHGIILARNTYSEEFAGRVAFLAGSAKVHGLTCDRTEFLGRDGSMAEPAALQRIGLSGKVEAGHDPCAALQIHVDLAPGEATEVVFLLGQARDREAAVALVQEYRQAKQLQAARETVDAFWDGVLNTVTVETPEPSMNLLLNWWLLYQTLSCRVWARSALYQPSGAYGFRDQLQDVMALTHAAPQLTREHILRSARHQFEAGDVLHWWHPPSARGVRTRCSDDFLWLPHVTAHFVSETQDVSVLREKVPFLSGEPLRPNELERYAQYAETPETYDLYEHCCRALERGLTRGRHGLPLMGSGDWDDGMNRVGIRGQGESVWLAWFTCTTLLRFAPLCELLGDKDRAARYRALAGQLSQTVEQWGWDGDWYLRAYDDEGAPLGSATNLECQITLLPQAWSVLSGVGSPERAAQAMEAVWQRLVREDDGLLLLLTPPFDKTNQDPGYVRGYPPGIRENGGQYTHAAIWGAWAFATLGQGDRAEMLFRMLNPIRHAVAPDEAARYRVEPYVVAGDVYSKPAHVGRGGWTWYTGSAGWMYGLGLEAILGLRRQGDRIRLEPCIPKGWPSYTIDYRHGTSQYHIVVENPHGLNRGVTEVSLDGVVQDDGNIPLLDDGRLHQARIRLG